MFALPLSSPGTPREGHELELKKKKKNHPDPRVGASRASGSLFLAVSAIKNHSPPWNRPQFTGGGLRAACPQVGG